jgi:hypothetical protein
MALLVSVYTAGKASYPHNNINDLQIYKGKNALLDRPYCS